MVKRGVACLLLALAVTAACSDDGTGPDPGSARLRVVHADPLMSPIDVLLDSSEVASDLGYLTATEYLEVEAGRHQLTFVDTTGGSPDTPEVDLADGGDYTVLACCSTFPGSTVLEDDNGTPPAGLGKIRVVHFASMGAVDIYVTEPGLDLELETPLLAAVEFFEVTDYLQVTAGGYRIRLTEAGTKTVLVDSGFLSLESGQVRTAIAADAVGGGEPFGLLVLEDVN